MIRLFRHPYDSQNWYAFSIQTGWVKFPAIIGGWAQRQPTMAPEPTYEVPVAQAFHTGMLEAVKDLRASAA
jgi:hypothetical protein